VTVPQAEGGGLSSCESEYITITTIATHVLRMLLELLGEKVDVVELKVDNKSALTLAKNPVFYERSKHIRIKYHFIRDCLEDGSIKASHILSLLISWLIFSPNRCSKR